MDEESHVKPEPPANQREGSTKLPLPDHVGSDEERPPSAQSRPIDHDEHAEEPSEGETADEKFFGQESPDADPAERIADFQWDELMARYHDAMGACDSETNELVAEFEKLMTYFGIWAYAGHNHESDRTYKRLCTRTAYVQNAEDKLESSRNHYITVVKAFESALNLLKLHNHNG